MSGRKLPRGVRLRGGKFYVDVSVEGVRRTATCDTLDAALKKRRELRATIAAGERPAQGRVGWTIQRAFEVTCSLPPKLGWKGAKAEVTAVKNARSALAYFGKDAYLQAIDHAALSQWVLSLAAGGNSGGTVNRKLAALSKMMSVAVRHGALASKPAFPRQHEAKGRVRFVTEVEEATALTLFQQWNMRDHADAFVVLLDTGLRCGELLALDGRDVELSRNGEAGHGWVRVWINKAEHPRSVPMTLRVADVLRRRKSERGDERLFPLTYSSLRVGWDRLRFNMGLAKDSQFTMHCLRHSCASRLVQRGVQLRVVQEWLGHKTLSVTMRYAHLAPKNLLDAVLVLEPVTGMAANVA